MLSAAGLKTNVHSLHVLDLKMDRWQNFAYLYERLYIYPGPILCGEKTNILKVSKVSRSPNSVGKAVKIDKSSTFFVA